MVHLLKIDEIKHLDVDGCVLWCKKDLLNIFHSNGEYFMLNVVFNTSSGITVPGSYYLGLDNRTTPALGDTLASLSGEPTQNGYIRAAVSSLNGFNVSLSSSNYRASSSVVTFSAAGGGWGPVTNLFLTTATGNTGYLLSTTSLGGSRTLLDGQSFTARVSLGLSN